MISLSVVSVHRLYMFMYTYHVVCTWCATPLTGYISSRILKLEIYLYAHVLTYPPIMDIQSILANLPLRRRCFFLTDRACMLSCWSNDTLRSALLERVRDALSTAHAQLTAPHTLDTNESEVMETVLHALHMLQCAAAKASETGQRDVHSGMSRNGSDWPCRHHDAIAEGLNSWDEGIEELLVALEMSSDASRERVVTRERAAIADKGGVGEVSESAAEHGTQRGRHEAPATAGLSASWTAMHRACVRDLLHALIDIFYAHGEVHYAHVQEDRISRDDCTASVAAAAAVVGLTSSRSVCGDEAVPLGPDLSPSCKRSREARSVYEREGGEEERRSEAGARVTWSVAAPLSAAVHAILLSPCTTAGEQHW